MKTEGEETEGGGRKGMHALRYRLIYFLQGAVTNCDSERTTAQE